MCQGIVLDTHGNDIDEKTSILNFKDLRNTLCDVVLSNIRITWTLFTQRLLDTTPLFYDSVDIGSGWEQTFAFLNCS